MMPIAIYNVIYQLILGSVIQLTYYQLGNHTYWFADPCTHIFVYRFRKNWID